MSNVTNGNGVTASQSPVGFDAIQLSDFYQLAGILHPITIGTIAIILLFFYLRLSSNRCVAPVTLFDWIINVALGSTLAGIVNGTSLVRGLIALVTLLAFQMLTSYCSSNYGKRLEAILNAPPLVIAFRGHALHKVMRRHRISTSDLNGALRKAGIWNIRQVEAVIIEPTGDFSIYRRDGKPEGLLAEVLLDIPGYCRLVDHFDGQAQTDGGREKGGDAVKKAGKEAGEEDVREATETANEIAGGAA